MCPKSQEELLRAIDDARRTGKKLRVAGSGHSSSALVKTSDVLLRMQHFSGIDDLDADNARAWVGSGTPLKQLGQLLHDAGWSMENLGDVDTQTIAGVAATGTHGSGRTLKNISSTVDGVRGVDGRGQPFEWLEEREPDLLRAAQVSLGALGIFSSLRLRLEPAYRLRRREHFAHTADVMKHFEGIANAHRNFDFYWYPRRDDVKVRTLNPPQAAEYPMPFARLVDEEVGFSHEIIARERTLKFEELEYFLPADAGLACFQELRERILSRHRKHVGWRVLFRLIARDDAWLSPVYERDSVAISVHQNATLPWRDYFADIETIVLRYGGRPHWGKQHSLTAAELRGLYPRWDDFKAVRTQSDPDGVFLTREMARLLDTSHAIRS
jgi:FAD/FMN-containing dehydrogenase